MKNVLSLVVLLCLALSVTPQKANDKKKKDPTNKYPQSGPVVVKANLLVLDAQDKYVEDVKPEEIKIFEDGAQQKITRFEKKVPPMHVGLVVDNTGSLRMYIDQIDRVSKLVVTNLQDGDGSFVVRFVDSDTVEVIQDHTTSKKDLFEAIDNLYIEGGQSAVFDAIYLAAEKVAQWEKKSPIQRFAIVLITDGEDRASYYDLDQTVAVVGGSGLQIFPIFFTGQLTDKRSQATNEKFGLSNSKRLAQVLALRTGGIASFIEGKPTDDTLLQVLKPIFIELRSQYVLTYESINQKRDGLERKLTVEIADGPNGAKRKGFIRPSFVVPLD